MTGADAFIWKILDHPEADLPRLVFADWLQEQGEEAHAEFIRLQCELATMTETDKGWMPKKVREGELFWENLRRKWIDPWQELGRGDLTLPEFSRGFIPSRGLLFGFGPVAHFARADRWPFLLSLSVRTNVSHIEPAFFASTQMQRVTRLDCSGSRVTDAALAPLATSPYYSRMTDLDLSGNQIGDAGVIALADSTSLTALWSLNLSGNWHFTHTGLEALVHTPHLPQLRELRVGRHSSANADTVAALRALYHRYGDGFDAWTKTDEDSYLRGELD